MSARMSVSLDRVSVMIRARLDYECWRVLREARISALDRGLPLHLDIEGCRGGDMGGLGSLLIAQHQLGKIAIDGCNQDFATWFNSIGVCARCTQQNKGGRCRDSMKILADAT